MSHQQRIENIQRRIREFQNQIKDNALSETELQQTERSVAELETLVTQLQATYIDESPADKPQLIEDIRGGKTI